MTKHHRTVHHGQWLTVTEAVMSLSRWLRDDEPYYPVPNPRNQALYVIAYYYGSTIAAGSAIVDSVLHNATYVV